MSTGQLFKKLDWGLLEKPQNLTGIEELAAILLEGLAGGRICGGKVCVHGPVYLSHLLKDEANGTCRVQIIVQHSRKLFLKGVVSKVPRGLFRLPRVGTYQSLQPLECPVYPDEP